MVAEKIVVKERRINCKDCISHSEHSRAIANLEKQSDKTGEAQNNMWRALDQRVPYSNFKWAFGIVMSVIVVVSSINFYTSRSTTSANYATMNKILESNHEVEKGLITVQSDIKSINEKMLTANEKMKLYYGEHQFFREAILLLIKDLNKKTAYDPMDRLNRVPSHVD